MADIWITDDASCWIWHASKVHEKTNDETHRQGQKIRIKFRSGQKYVFQNGELIESLIEDPEEVAF